MHQDNSRTSAHSSSEGPGVRERVYQDSSADHGAHGPPISQTQSKAQCAVKVTGISRGTSQDLLLNYFENSRRSHGGPVADLVFKPSLNMAFVTFESAAGERLGWMQFACYFSIAIVMFLLLLLLLLLMMILALISVRIEEKERETIVYISTNMQTYKQYKYTNIHPPIHSYIHT